MNAVVSAGAGIALLAILVMVIADVVTQQRLLEFEQHAAAAITVAAPIPPAAAPACGPALPAIAAGRCGLSGAPEFPTGAPDTRGARVVVDIEGGRMECDGPDAAEPHRFPSSAPLGD